MTRSLRLLAGYLAGVLLVLAALATVTAASLDLESRERAARAEVEFQSRITSALWVLESRIGALLGVEAARPPSHFRPFSSPARAWMQVDGKKQAPAPPVLLPSPLLATTSPIFRLHFEIGPDGVLRSAQVPAPSEPLDEDLASNPTVRELMACQVKLVDLSQEGQFQAALAGYGTAESEAQGLETEEPPDAVQVRNPGMAPEEASNDLRNRQRAQSFTQNLNAFVVDTLAQRPVLQTVLSPRWVSRTHGPPELFLFRRIEEGGYRAVQGIWVDWPALRDLLLMEVRDTVPGAELLPLVEETGPRPAGAALAGLPAIVSAPAPQVAEARGLTPIRWILLITWIATLGALLGLGLALRALTVWLDRRSRFVRAVTHELRTPLTTFHMYSQMLDEGMVAPESVAEYHRTLARESERLVGIVESVLLHSRLQEGRRFLRAQAISAAQLVAEVRPRLEALAGRHGQTILWELDPLDDLVVAADPRAVEQILANLVENAGKYAGPGTGPEDPRGRIVVEARGSGSGLLVRVRDFGPGVPRDLRRRLFAPFGRAARHESSVIPGVGLGLSTARDLARALGGDLLHEAEPGPGASFALSLPGAGPPPPEPRSATSG